MGMRLLAGGALISALALAAWAPIGTPKFDRSEPVLTWQSYSASPAGIHEWRSEKAPYTVERLPDVSPDFRTGYAFVNHGKLVFFDLANKEQYRRVLGLFYMKEWIRTNRRRFYTRTTEFRFKRERPVVDACSRAEEDACIGMKIQDDTFPYVYAESNGAVLTITNFGDALLFKDNHWCRMEMTDDVYECRTENAPILQEPRKIQFYSSIVYRGRTLLGEWPTGRIYEFDGKTLRPSEMTPPAIAGAGRVGYEAQSMAMYCGDLFVGYWPKGEIYRLDGETNEWSLFAGLFEGVSNGDFVPFRTRVRGAGEKISPAFYGQRVTALVPYGDSLYATTSNLISWTRDIKSSFLTDDQTKRYGAVYRIHRDGCRTTYRAD